MIQQEQVPLVCTIAAQLLGGKNACDITTKGVSDAVTVAMYIMGEAQSKVVTVPHTKRRFVPVTNDDGAAYSDVVPRPKPIDSYPARNYRYCLCGLYCTQGLFPLPFHYTQG